MVSEKPAERRPRVADEAGTRTEVSGRPEDCRAPCGPQADLGGRFASAARRLLRNASRDACGKWRSTQANRSLSVGARMCRRGRFVSIISLMARNAITRATLARKNSSAGLQLIDIALSAVGQLHASLRRTRRRRDTHCYCANCQADLIA